MIYCLLDGRYVTSGGSTSDNKRWAKEFYSESEAESFVLRNFIVGIDCAIKFENVKTGETKTIN